ncbi:hypothetical protein chiPu_0019694 [Chiloscyllium punctatum]|uniref:Uncharacterized protein n=1 Tax=Chiloscyllium punctatum TaxID=137246 RepID=A0A401RSW0_CHIPU|nr:hypothetical protein [Chiloscyllium punctatum]
MGVDQECNKTRTGVQLLQQTPGELSSSRERGRGQRSRGRGEGRTPPAVYPTHTHKPQNRTVRLPLPLNHPTDLPSRRQPGSDSPQRPEMPECPARYLNRRQRRRRALRPAPNKPNPPRVGTTCAGKPRPPRSPSLAESRRRRLPLARPAVCMGRVEREAGKVTSFNRWLVRTEVHQEGAG